MKLLNESQTAGRADPFMNLFIEHLFVEQSLYQKLTVTSHIFVVDYAWELAW